MQLISNGSAFSFLRTVTFATLAVVSGSLFVGCGAVDQIGGVSSKPDLRAIDTYTCDSAPDVEDAYTLVVLDWDGGSNPMVQEGLSPFTIEELTISDYSDSLTDLDTAYRAAVLGRVREMLCVLDPMDITVIEGDGDDYPDATVVHITGDKPRAGGMHIGQSTFDMCNERPDDSAVIWVGVMVDNVSQATFAEWVNIVANTTTHEIGHTIGFAHPSAENVGGRMLPVPDEEVMRINVTVAQLRKEQNFVIEQNTCPSNEEYAYRLIRD